VSPSHLKESKIKTDHVKLVSCHFVVAEHFVAEHFIPEHFVAEYFVAEHFVAESGLLPAVMARQQLMPKLTQQLTSVAVLRSALLLWQYQSSIATTHAQEFPFM
jgi:hypothetical protein